MATNKTEETARINLELQAQNLKPTLVDIEKMVAAFDALPEKARLANKPLGELSKAFKAIAEAFKEGFSPDGAGINSMADSAKEMKGLLKILKDVKAGFEAIQKGSAPTPTKDVVKDLTEAINKVEKFNQAMAKAGQTSQKNVLIQKGAFGLDTTTLKGAEAALKTLETRATALRHQMQALGLDNRMTKSPVVQESKVVQKNIGALTEHRAGLVTQAEAVKTKQGSFLDWAKDIHETSQARAKEELKAQLKADKAVYEARKADVMGRRRARQGLTADEIRDIHETSQARAKEEIKAQLKADKAVYEARKADVMGRRRARLVSREGLSADRLRDAQFQGELSDRMVDGRVVAKANTTILARDQGAGTQAFIGAGARKDNKALLEEKGITQAILGMSHEMGKLAQQKILNQREIGRLLASNIPADQAVAKRLIGDNQALKKQIAELRTAEKGKDPKAAEQERANSLLTRVRGVGGAALMGVQANLMFNYSVLAGITGTIRSAVTNSVQLEASFRNVQAVTATTSTEMGKLEGQIRSIAASSKFSANEVAQAALVLGQAGLSSKEVGEALPAVLTLAAAAGTSLAQAVDLATSVLGVFDKKASDTADIANKITQAANTSKVSVDKLALGLQYAGNIAAQSGISFEETTAAMAVMSNAGIRSGSTMGTGLRQFLIELQKPSQEFLKTLSQLGLSLSDVDLRAKGLTGVVKTLRSAGFVASDAIKSFDVRGAAAFNALLADPAALERQYQGLLNTNAAVAANAIQMNSLQAQTTRLATSFSNFASVGLDPVVKLLTVGASAVATFTQMVAESEVASRLLVSALVGLGAAGITRALIDRVGGITALWTSLKATQVATAATTAVTLASLPAITGSGIAANVAAGGFARATAAAVGFGAALKGLGMATWVGLALTALVTAFTMFESGASKAAKALDKLKSESNEAKAAFEEKEGAVKSLTKKIEDLEYKEASLKNMSQAELKPTLLELKSEFGKYGLQIDMVNDSYSTMIQKLRDLKLGMSGLAESRLGAQLTAQEAIRDAQKEKSDKARVDFQGPNMLTGGASKGLRSLGDFFKGTKLSPEQQERLTKGLNNLRGGSRDEGVLLDSGESVLQLAREIADTGKPKVKEMFKELNTIVREDLLGPLSATLEAQGTVVETKARREKMVIDKADAKALEAGPKLKDFGTLAKLQSGGKKLEGLDLHLAVRPLLEAEMAKAEEMLKDSKTTDGQKQALRLTVEGLRTKLSDTWNQRTQEEFKLKTEEMVRSLRKKDGSLDPKASRELRAAREIEFSKLGVLGSDATAELRQRVAGAKLAEDNQKALDKSNAKAGRNNQSGLIASLNRQASAFESRANTSKRSTVTAESMDEVDKALGEGLGFLAAGKAMALRALFEEQARTTPVGSRSEETKMEMEAATVALKQSWEDKLENYRNSFLEIDQAVMKRLDKSGRALQLLAAQEALKLLQNEGEDAIYAAGEDSRKLALEVAAGTRAGDGLSVQQAAVAEAKVKLAELQKQMKLLGDDTTGYIGLLLKAFEDAKGKREAIEAELNVTLDKAQEDRLRGRLTTAQGTESSALDALRSGRKTKQGLQSGIQDTSQFLAGNQLPQEATIDSLMGKIQEAGTKYQDFLAKVDINKSIGEGFTGVFQQSTGAMSTFFTELATRSKSAGDAFRGMAATMIKAMIEVLAQALAMQAVKGIMSMFGFPMMGGGGSMSGGVQGGFSGSSPTFAAKGGLITGGIPGKDSVPIMGMPGEVIIPKTTVDAVGADYLLGLKARTANTTAQGRASVPASKARQPDLTNVWIVAPEAKPTMGPKDVVMVITDDMMRGGATRQLVRQIQTGAA